MPKEKKYGLCRICGREKELSFEHVPPRVAFNKTTRHISVSMMDYARVDNPLQFIPKGKILQGGVGYYSLCRDCNSFLGRTYVPAYRKWVRSGYEIISKHKLDYIKYVALQLEPLKILKQIISMFVAINDEWYLKEYPELSEFVKDSNSNFLPEKYRVFLYLNSEGQSRYSRHSTSSHPGLGILNSTELTFPPFGYVLTFNFDHDIDKFVNITSFKNFSSDDIVDITLGLYRLPTYLPFPPLDYRSKQKIEQDVKDGLLSTEKLIKMGYKSS